MAANWAVTYSGTSAPRAGQELTFLDQSFPTPASWEWDFGDGSAPVAVGPSGAAMPAYDLAGWRLAQAHDFNTNYPIGSFGPTVNDVPAEFAGLLRVYEDDWRDTASSSGGNPALPSRYMPSQVLSCSGGMMVWRLFNDGAGARSACVMVGGDTLYGRYAFRFRADSVDGFKTAVLTWPQSGIWPRDGEIDFPEGALQGGTIDAFMHRQGATSGSDQDYRTSGQNFQSWHTAVIEWAPNSCKFILDGSQLGATITSRVPNTPMHYVLQIESHLGGNQPPVGTNGYLYCDWVCRWTYDPSATDQSAVAVGSTLQNPVHVYAEPGTYNVTLTADGTDSITLPITVEADVTGIFGEYYAVGIQLEAPTMTASGVVEIPVTGTLAVTTDPPTMEAAGSVTTTEVTGTLAATADAPVMAAVGEVTGVRTVLVCPTLPASSAAGGARGAAGKLFGRYRGAPREASVLKIGGVYITVAGPTTDQLSAATEVYLGGHVNELTGAQVAALTEAGYTTRVE